MRNGDGNSAEVHGVHDVRGGRVGAGGLLAVWRETRGYVALAVLGVLIAYWWLTMVAIGTPGDWAFDFRQFWQGGKDVIDGSSPYPSSALLATAGDQLDPEGIREVFRFPYPAGAAVALAPFGLLGFHAAAAVWSAILIVSLLGGLWLLDVRDWRVLGVVVTSAPVISAVRLGTLTPVLILLLAVSWRWRDRMRVAAPALAAAIALKLFLWPLVVWLAATRRYATAVVTLVLTLIVTALAWASIGFAGLTTYPDLLRRLTDVVADRGYSLVALGAEAGLPEPVARLLPWLVGLALLAGLVKLADRADGDRTAFSVAIVAAIAFTPIVWLHYFALLVVPLALARPRFSWAWCLLWVFWLFPDQENHGEVWRIAVALLVVAVVATAVVVRPRLLPRGAAGG